MIAQYDNSDFFFLLKKQLDQLQGGVRVTNKQQYIVNPPIVLDDVFLSSPEWGAVMYYRAKGALAFRTENMFWIVLFGIAFIDIVDLTSPSLIEKPKDSVARYLLDWYRCHKQTIENRLSSLDVKKLKTIILRNILKFYKKRNCLFSWSKFKVDPLFLFLNNVNHVQINLFFRQMFLDFSNGSIGLPDILVKQQDAISFIEIKTKNDSLRAHQVAKIEFLNSLQIVTSVQEVQFNYNSEQVYVVIDVETTGSLKTYNRVIEIGAVKCQGGHVIEQWSTLINPQRTIPVSITRLNGITQQMVEDAPVFADIVGELSLFLKILFLLLIVILIISFFRKNIKVGLLLSISKIVHLCLY